MKTANRATNLIRSLSLLGALSAAVAASTALAQTNSAAPWVTLFNGKDLTGWTIKGDPTGKVSVKDGQITCNQTTKTAEHTFVSTVAKYRDFILETEVKIDGPFNSGILFHCVDVPESERTPSSGKNRRSSLDGYQIKIDPTPRKWTGGIFADYGANWEWYYSLENDSRAREAFKLGEWNIFRVEAIGKVLKVWVNGVPVTHLVHGKYKEGYIAFKIHSLSDKPDDPNLLGYFRNIRIITENPASYARPMDLPAKIVE